MKLTITTIPHERQRYDTVGDWKFTPRGHLMIRVSQMGDPRYETLIALHELVEAVLCREAGIDQREVDRFDMAYETSRHLGDKSEPGDDPAAPYHHQHVSATWFEQHLAGLLHVDWEAYDAEVESK